MQKKTSLKKTISLLFVAVFASLLLLLYIISKCFLQNYYLSEKVKILDLAYSTIDRAVELAGESDETLFDLINDEYGQSAEDSPTVAIFRALNERSNIDIALMNSDRNLYAATSREAKWLVQKLNAYMDIFDDHTSIPDFNALESEIQEEESQDNPAETDEIIESDSEKPETDEAGYSETGQSSDSALSEAEEQAEGEASTESELPSETAMADDESKNGFFSKFNDEKQYKVLEQKENYIIQRIYDWRSETNYIECFGVFSDDDTFFLMSMPLSNIDEGVQVANRFMFLTGICILFLGAIVVYLCTDRLVSPLNKLAKLSDRMSSLNFDERYEGCDNNEIGVLGQSMNKMSDALAASISDLKEANKKLQDDIQEKIKIDEARKEFIANVSHELKTPIALIEGYAEGLTEGIAEDKESRDYYCGVIIDETVKMNKMVRQLTSLISYEFGSNTIDEAEFNICDLIRSVTSSLKLKLEDKNANVHVMLPQCVMVSGDEFKIEEVYTNYLNNAMNHLDGERNIIIRLDDENDKTTVYVYNDGAAIPEESIPHLWEKFYKVDKARTRAYGGSGIGLSIVKAIMDAHKGGYGVKNVDQGVEFYFSLKKKTLDEQTQI